MRPRLEVADIFRRHGPAYRQAHAEQLGSTERRVMAAIEACRTSALGGHAEQCADCGFVRYAYNSCLMGKFCNGESTYDLTAGLAQGKGLVPRASLWLPIKST